LESRRKDIKYRKTQALSLFENIASQFPSSPKAPESLYRAALIQYYYFGDNISARDKLEKLISDFPKSAFADYARELYESMDSAPLPGDKSQPGAKTNISIGR
ncbi:MAG: tetratricopeptide repeat protein, partial [Candidatus Omnitrophica bacterium]|nr:tetratricopeptide repeat protein [Candidatus Omnitrophota bacterium]